MARITYTAIIAEIKGKIGGTVFQAGQGGYQAKTNRIPRDVPVRSQVVNRMNLTSVAQTWRTLSNSDRTSWNGNADPGLSPYSTYLKRNNNMMFFQESPFSTFPGPGTPAFLVLGDTSVTSSSFVVAGVGSGAQLASGTKAALMATRCRSNGRASVSPSEYVLIDYVDGPWDFEGDPVNITTAYTSALGPLRVNTRLSFAVKVIDKSSGIVLFCSQGDFFLTT